MKLIRSLVLIAVVAYASVLTYSMWYGPVVSHVPALRPFLPEPASVVHQGAAITLSPAGPAVPTAAPIAVVTPSSALVATVPWSQSDCYFAGSVLLYDYGLDNSEWQAIADGSDRRFPKSDIPAYQRWAQDWWQALTDVRSMCKYGVPVAAADITRDVTNFTLAVNAHEADIVADPSNAGWDRLWIGRYQRLLALYGRL